MKLSEREKHLRTLGLKTLMSRSMYMYFRYISSRADGTVIATPDLLSEALTRSTQARDEVVASLRELESRGVIAWSPEVGLAYLVGWNQLDSMYAPRRREHVCFRLNGLRDLPVCKARSVAEAELQPYARQFGMTDTVCA